MEVIKVMEVMEVMQARPGSYARGERPPPPF
jgi:hypothetical protein